MNSACLLLPLAIVAGVEQTGSDDRRFAGSHGVERGELVELSYGLGVPQDGWKMHSRRPQTQGRLRHNLKRTPTGLPLVRARGVKQSAFQESDSFAAVVALSVGSEPVISHLKALRSFTQQT